MWRFSEVTYILCTKKERKLISLISFVSFSENLCIVYLLLSTTHFFCSSPNTFCSHRLQTFTTFLIHAIFTSTHTNGKSSRKGYYLCFHFVQLQSSFSPNLNESSHFRCFTLSNRHIHHSCRNQKQ